MPCRGTGKTRAIPPSSLAVLEDPVAGLLALVTSFPPRGRATAVTFQPADPHGRVTFPGPSPAVGRRHPRSGFPHSRESTEPRVPPTSTPPRTLKFLHDCYNLLLQFFHQQRIAKLTVSPRKKSRTEMDSLPSLNSHLYTKQSLNTQVYTKHEDAKGVNGQNPKRCMIT